MAKPLIKPPIQELLVEGHNYLLKITGVRDEWVKHSVVTYRVSYHVTGKPDKRFDMQQNDIRLNIENLLADPTIKKVEWIRINNKIFFDQVKDLCVKSKKENVNAAISA